MIKNFGPHAEATGADPPPQRSERLPLQPVGWPSVALALADWIAAQTAASVVVMTLSTREIEQALSRLKEQFALFEISARRPVDRDFASHTSGLARDVARQCQQSIRLGQQRHSALIGGTALIDAQLEIEKHS